MEELRWKQRFEFYQRSLKHLHDFAQLEPLTELNEFGLIKAFELTYEMAWKTLKDFFIYQGNTEKLFGSRDVFRKAYDIGLLDKGPVWMDMVDDRNGSAHEYILDTKDTITAHILSSYLELFDQLESTLLAQL